MVQMKIIAQEDIEDRGLSLDIVSQCGGTMSSQQETKKRKDLNILNSTRNFIADFFLIDSSATYNPHNTDTTDLRSPPPIPFHPLPLTSLI